MTIKELQGLVEQLAAQTVIQAQQQNVINQLLTEGVKQTGNQVQALLNHEQALFSAILAARRTRIESKPDPAVDAVMGCIVNYGSLCNMPDMHRSEAERIVAAVRKADKEQQ